MERRTGMEGFVRWRPGEEAHRSFSGTVAEVGDGSGGIGRSAEVTPCGSGARRSAALLQADEGFRGRRRWFFGRGAGHRKGVERAAADLAVAALGAVHEDGDLATGRRAGGARVGGGTSEESGGHRGEGGVALRRRRGQVRVSIRILLLLLLVCIYFCGRRRWTPATVVVVDDGCGVGDVAVVVTMVVLVVVKMAGWLRVAEDGQDGGFVLGFVEAR
ncbi:uncharacterized protein M6B38_169970 [Iris pallida]|uniref:Uncharacterized protein n=1 Tax=Iris pallida TaxID=29817 RepID=A0AAX6EV30_IRIPA|nr:uncharacterized protein M6B38_169970 [Iris pallida]